MNQLQKLVRKSILEVLKEDYNTPSIKGTVNISSDDPDENDKVQQAQQNKQSYSLYEDEQLDEMARIATLVKGGDPKQLKISATKYKGTWVGDLLNAVITNPNGITQTALAVAAGKTRQQDINPWIRKFLQDGTLTTGELVTPKQEKPDSTGILGRPKTEEGTRRDVAKALMQKFKEDPNYKPIKDEYRILGGKDEIKKIKDLVLSGGIRRGRKIGSSIKSDEQPPNLTEMARISTKYRINDDSLLTDRERDNKWVAGIIDFLNEKGSASIIQIAQEKFGRAQQSINQLVQAMVKKGILAPDDERDNRKMYAKKQNTYHGEEVPEEFADEVDTEDNSPIGAEDYFIGNRLSSRIKTPVEPFEQDPDGEPEIPVDLKKNGLTHNPKISDQDYQDLIKYLDYKERIKKIDNDMRKENTKSNYKKSDSSDLSTSKSSSGNLSKIKNTYEEKLRLLISNSPYLQSKISREKDNGSMVAEGKRMQKLANING